MRTAKLFANGGSQAVRLPKDCRFDATEVYVHRLGNSVVLFPKDDPWAPFVASLDQFTEDFLEKRKQGIVEEREPF